MKSKRIETLVASLKSESAGNLPVHYLVFFQCFNAGNYYEAHDVLEHLWLTCSDANKPFYKGLIQIAGAFVHLKKHYERPNHPKDSRRLHPAIRLLALGMKNIEAFAPYHLGLDISELCIICHHMSVQIQASDFLKNPWSPQNRPILRMST